MASDDGEDDELTAPEPWPARRILVVVGLPLFVLLVVGAVFVSVPSMERDLERRALSDLAEAGFDVSTLTVTFDGRDATVRGTVTSQSARATIDDVIAHDGVRVVTVAVRNTELDGPAERTVIDDATVDATVLDEMMSNDAALSVSLEDGVVVLRGRIRTQSNREALVQRLAATVAPTPLRFELQVDPEAERGNDFGLAVDVVETLLPDATDFVVLVDSSTLFVDAGVRVDPAAIITRLEELAEAAGLEAEINVRFEVPVPTAQDLLDGLEARAVGDAVFVAGTAELTAGADALLDELASIVVDGVSVELRVHVDGPAGDEATVLSQQQADLLVAELVERGVDASAIAGVGAGAGEPVADEGDPANRRVEMTVVS